MLGYILGYIAIWFFLTVIYALVMTDNDQTNYPLTIMDKGWDHYLMDYIAQGLMIFAVWPVVLPAVVVTGILWLIAQVMAAFIKLVLEKRHGD